MAKAEIYIFQFINTLNKHKTFAPLKLFDSHPHNHFISIMFPSSIFKSIPLLTRTLNLIPFLTLKTKRRKKNQNQPTNPPFSLVLLHPISNTVLWFGLVFFPGFVLCVCGLQKNKRGEGRNR